MFIWKFKALEYLGKSCGIQRARELATEHANLAAAAIDSLPESDDEDVINYGGHSSISLRGSLQEPSDSNRFIT